MKDKTKLSDSDQQLFRQAMADVTPLSRNVGRHRKTDKTEVSETKTATIQTPKKIKRQIPLNFELSDHYTKIVSADEKLSYQQVGLAGKTIQLLRQGNYPIDATLDLHGLTVAVAKMRVCQIVLDQYKKNHRCILIIHGKSHVSEQHPILKNHVNHWLTQIPIVLAFCSAAPKDGGTGAVYVLLKKQRK